jgi:hypothetical protein
VNKLTFGYFSAVLILGMLSPSLGQAQSVETYTHTYNYPGTVSHTTVLDSWMQPVVVRSRAVTDENGNTQDFVEPIIMERHERVLVPTGETITTTNTKHVDRVGEPVNRRVVSARRVTRAYQNPRRTFVAQGYRHHRSTRTTGSERNRYIVRREVVESTPSVLESRERVVQRAVIIERRDPALNLY